MMIRKFLSGQIFIVYFVVILFVFSIWIILAPDDHQNLVQKNPKKRYLANVNTQNKKSMRFFKNNGFKLIQYTLELSKI